MTIVVLAAIGGVGPVSAATNAACDTPPGAYPSFCSIPPTPTNLASPATVHAEVLDTRLAGRRVVEQSAPSSFTLDDTTGFAGRAITEAAPPPPVTTSSEADTEAFAKAARAKAIPPKHHR